MASGRTSLSLATEAVAGSGVQVRMHAAASETAEAEFIAREIEHWLGGTSQFSMDSGLVGRASESGGVSLGDVAILTRLRATMPPLLEALANLGLPAQAAGDASLIEKQGAREFVAAFQACLEGAPHESTGALLKLLEQRKDLSLDARERLKECAGLACAGLQPQAFLDSLMLRQGADEYDEKVEKIAVLTMHAAKGLEFPIVFIAGCEEGLIPYEAEGRESDPAEERRLFYVAMTRAQRVLYLTRAGSRRMFGRSFSPQPSPYLSDISQTLKQDIRRASTRRSKKDNQLKFRFE